MNSKDMQGYQNKGGVRERRPPQELQMFDRTLDVIDVKELVEKAEDNAQVFHGEKIKANQIRNFYGAVEKIKMKYSRYRDKIQAVESVKQDLWLLLPQLAYAKGRNGSTGKFCTSMKNAVEMVLHNDLDSSGASRSIAIEHFFIYVESVVAYHKYYGDK